MSCRRILSFSTLGRSDASTGFGVGREGCPSHVSGGHVQGLEPLGIRWRSKDGVSVSFRRLSIGFLRGRGLLGFAPPVVGRKAHSSRTSTEASVLLGRKSWARAQGSLDPRLIGGGFPKDSKWRGEPSTRELPRFHRFGKPKRSSVPSMASWGPLPVPSFPLRAIGAGWEGRRRR